MKTLFLVVRLGTSKGGGGVTLNNHPDLTTEKKGDVMMSYREKILGFFRKKEPSNVN